MGWFFKTNNMKTAMQDLIEIMMEEWGEGRGLPDWAEEALENEKWQIINAVNNGDSTNFWVDFDSAEDYYNQTYNQNK